MTNIWSNIKQWVISSDCIGLSTVKEDFIILKCDNTYDILQSFHYILVVKFKDFSRTLKLHFQGSILDGSLQHGQYYSNI